MDEGSMLSWLVILFLMLRAFYFASAETAFSSVSRIKIKSELDRGDLRARKALYILDHFDKAITTILIGTNIVQIVMAAVVTVLVTRKWGLSAVTISTIVTTLVLFFVGEMLPKSIGKKYSSRFALSLAPSLKLLMGILSPLAYLLSQIGQFAARLTRAEPELTVTEDELYDIIESMKDEGGLDAERGELIHSALMFADVTVESIVTPRVDLAAVDIEKPLPEIVAYVKASRHSRFPVYEGTIDNIIGVLQIRRFIKAYLKHGDSLDLRTVLDEIYFAHQSTKIDELLSEMSRKKLNMAIVTDNYGGTLGIVTVEDILEELVGDIWDEDDEVKESCVLNADGSFDLDPELGIEEAFDLIGFEDPEDFEFEHKLLGEWVYEHFERIPEAGDAFDYNGLSIQVKEMCHNRIVKLTAVLPTTVEREGRRER